MGIYKIKDIEALTGIKAHTIRIWEKRYNILNPERSDTQIRMYSDEDLLRLLQVSILNKNGVKISKIIELKPSEIASQIQSFQCKISEENVIDRFIVSLIQLDEQLFNSTYHEVMEKQGVGDTFTHYLFPFLERIGIMWIVGSINPAQEHFISNLIRQKIISEIDKLPIHTSDKKVIIFLPEDEWHELSLLIYHFEFRRNGYQTVYLGQSLPYDALLKSIEFVRPTHILTAWVMNVDESVINNYFSELTKQVPHITILLGGGQSEKIKSIAPNLHIFRKKEDLLRFF